MPHHPARFFPLVVASLICCAPLLAQQQQQPAPPPQAPQPSPTPSPEPGGRTPTIPTPTPIPSPREPQREPDFRQQQPFPEIQRPIFLSGRVMLEDGTPPPEPVIIERVCNGQPRPEAYTDSKGRFSFQLGQNTNLIADASVNTAADSFGDPTRRSPGAGFGQTRTISERDLIGCELRAVLPGYRSDVVSLAGRRLMDNPDVGTIVLRRLGKVEGTVISATTLAAPKDARKAYEKGLEAIRKKKLDEARAHLEKAVTLYPQYAVAWYELGRVHQQQNSKEKAREAYGKALEADARFMKPYLQLALLSAQERNWQEVADITDRLLKLDPYDYPQAWFFHSVANFNLRKLDA
ncbi:MAG: tetratricopeptide repeat protein, partial [Bryobacteraceae bacterium]